MFRFSDFIRLKESALYPLLLVNFIGTLGFSLVLPFLIFLVTRFGGNAQIYGILGATYPAFQLLGAAILGKWSDIYGRKIILILSQAGTLCSWLIFLTALYVPVVAIQKINSDIFGIFTVSVPLIILFVARALDGLTGGNISVAHAYLADITREEERNKNFGRMAISANLGFIIGPALAGILGSTPLKETLPVMAAILISGIALLIIFFALPESNRSEIEKDRVTVKQNHASSQDSGRQSDKIDIKIRHIFKLKHIPYLFVIYFMIYLAFSIFYTSFPVHAAEKLEWNIKDLGIYFAFLSSVMIIIQGPVLTKLSKIFSEAFLIITGNLILGTNFILLTQNKIELIYLAAILFALGNGLMWPSLLTVLSRVAGKRLQGSVQGFAASAGSMASILGLILGGFLYGAIAELTFLISAVILYLIFILSFGLVRVRMSEKNN